MLKGTRRKINIENVDVIQFYYFQSDAVSTLASLFLNISIRAMPTLLFVKENSGSYFRDKVERKKSYISKC
jgi:hypothetical protein